VPKRKIRLIETRMISEWIMKVYPGAKKIIRVWLGPIGESTTLARAGVTPRVMMPFGGGWADALILGPDWTRIVEACVVLDTRHVGALEGYLDLFSKTAEYRDRWDMEIIGTLLYGYPRTVAMAMATRKGYETIRYRPAFIRAYYHEKAGIVPRR